MSELKNERNIRLRRRLLTSASVFVLVAAVAMRGAKAADADEDRPQFWIELGGQLSRLDDSQEAHLRPRSWLGPALSVCAVGPGRKAAALQYR